MTLNQACNISHVRSNLTFKYLWTNYLTNTITGCALAGIKTAYDNSKSARLWVVYMVIWGFGGCPWVGGSRGLSVGWVGFFSFLTWRCSHLRGCVFFLDLIFGVGCVGLFSQKTKQNQQHNHHNFECLYFMYSNHHIL